VDPLAEFSTGTTPWEPIRQDSESLDSGEEWVAYDEAPFEMPLLVDDAMDSEEQGALADDSDDTSDDSMLDSGEWILLDELESSATAAETVDAEVPDYDALEEFPWVMEENPTALDSTSDPEVESTQGETEEAPLEGDGWYVEASPSEQELDLEGTPSELAEPTMPGDSQEPVTVMETPVAVGPLEVMEAQPAFDEATNGNVDEAMPMDLANGDESVEPATNLNEAMGVSSEPTEGPMEPLAEGTTEDEFEAPEGRNLLDMYSDWNQAENEGQLQTMSTSMWMNFSIGDGAALPFRVAQAGLHSREESGETQPEPVVEETTTQTAPVGILKRRKADGDHWQGKEVPMHAMANKKILLTPKVGPVRVIAKDGETIEGRLHGIGQNYVWLNTNLGRLSVPSRRVERVERLDPNQYSAEVKSVQDYTKLPKVRVRMKGGVITGYELAREGNRITIRTEKGHKMTLVSDDIQSATSHKATGIKRRIE
jgi:hypothetical protein